MRTRYGVSLALLLVVVTACEDGGPTEPPVATPSQLQVVDGDEQAGAAGEPLADPIVVRTVDASGQPVAGVTVTFAVAAGGGSVHPTSATTSTDGRAQTTWTLGGPGEQQVSAAVEGVQAVTVTAEAMDLALCGAISADRTLRGIGTPYVLCSSGAQVGSEATLVIEPGVTIRAEEQALLRIRSDGVLRAVGTQADPVRILGQTEEPGFWRGIWHESGLDGNELERVEIAHGGGGAYSNLHLSHESRIRIRDSVFRDSEDWGIHAAAAAVSLPEFERNEFRGNGIAAVRIYPEQLQFLDRASVFEGNAADVIDVRQGTLSGDPHTVPNPGVPYRLYWLDISTDLTLEPGITFISQDEHAARIRVRTDGSLDAQGTAESPIRFLGERPAPGSWGGIWIESDADNVLDHVEVAHGGRGDRSNLSLSGSARVVITNSTFRDGSDYGIAVTAPGVSLPSFSANNLRGNELRAMRINAQHMRYIDTETTARDNGEDVIEVRPGVLEGSAHAWRATDVPFLLVGGVDVRTSLVVEPGFRMLAAEGAQTIRIRDGASINAVGTPLNMIRFTAQNGEAGAWSGLWIESSGNQLRFVEIAHGGRGSFHNIYIAGNASLTVTNSIIRNSAAYGIYVASQSSTLNQSDNSFSANANGNIRTP
jgi:hypothetical protein